MHGFMEIVLTQNASSGWRSHWLVIRQQTGTQKKFVNNGDMQCTEFTSTLNNTMLKVNNHIILFNNIYTRYDVDMIQFRKYL